jgi:hypothetical protein
VPKVYRKSIRIDGKLVTKEFTRAEDAKAWYAQMHSKKVFGDFGLNTPKPKSGMLFKEFALGEFMAHRKAHYPDSTWKSDNQRLRDYVVPTIGNMRLTKIRVQHVRQLLVGLV